jgi:hypothetical protein
MLEASVPNVSSIFQMYVASVFIVMLHMFHTMLQVFYFDVAYVCNGFQVFFSRVFASVSRTCFKCFICLFLSPHLLLSCLGVSSPFAVLHPSQTCEGRGGGRGMAASM